MKTGRSAIWEVPDISDWNEVGNEDLCSFSLSATLLVIPVA